MSRARGIQAATAVLLIVLLVLVGALVRGSYILHVFILVMMNVVLASSLRLINLTGQLSLAHGGMVAIGAYTAALLVLKAGVSSWLSLLAGALMAGVISCAIGVPFTRLKGIYFTMVSIFFVQVVTLILQQWRELTGGASGLYNIPRPDPIFGVEFRTKTSFFFLILVLMVVSLLIIWAIERSRIGLTFAGIKQAESLAESVGINATLYKVLALGIGGFFAGLIGGFYAQYVSALDPTAFGFLFTIYILIYMIVGGAGHFVGPIVGATLLTVLPEVARPLKSFMPILFAAILMAVIFLMPEGLVGLPARIKKLLAKPPSASSQGDAYAESRRPH